MLSSTVNFLVKLIWKVRKKRLKRLRADKLLSYYIKYFYEYNEIRGTKSVDSIVKRYPAFLENNFLSTEASLSLIYFLKISRLKKINKKWRRKFAFIGVIVQFLRRYLVKKKFFIIPSRLSPRYTNVAASAVTKLLWYKLINRKSLFNFFLKNRKLIKKQFFVRNNLTWSLKNLYFYRKKVKPVKFWPYANLLKKVIYIRFFCGGSFNSISFFDFNYKLFLYRSTKNLGVKTRKLRTDLFKSSILFTKIFFIFKNLFRIRRKVNFFRSLRVIIQISGNLIKTLRVALFFLKKIKLNVFSVVDITGVPHNGCRLPKKKRKKNRGRNKWVKKLIKI